MNQVHKKKLLHSKWTAVIPRQKRKHYIVTDVDYDEDGQVIECILEAVIDKHRQDIDWRSLKDTSIWRSGWC